MLATDPTKIYHEAKYSYWQDNLKEKCLFGPKSDKQIKPGSMPEKKCRQLYLSNATRSLHCTFPMSVAWEEGK